MTGEENESGDVPTHDENTNRHSYDGRSQGIYVSKIFRRKKERFRSEGAHEASVHYCEKKEPAKQEHLVFSKVQKEQLQGK